MEKKQELSPSPSHTFPPVVAVLGHVDHGKTTLLDTIRKSNIAQREHGGITQKIGASTIEILHEKEKRKITFIDTPGHEAFSQMRGRGVQAADIGLLIVSAVDGVKPQTKESIEILKESNIPFIVVFTKIDMDTALVEKVKQQLLKEQIMLEGYGGEIPFIEVSAKTGQNIKELLDLIVLVYDLSNKTSPQVSTLPLEAVIIESKMDQKAGPRATLIIKKGTISLRDTIYAEDISGKARTLITDSGAQVQSASVGDAVELLGFESVPRVGSVVTHTKQSVQPVVAETVAVEPSASPVFFQKEKSVLSMIVSADTQGSLEAILQNLPKGVDVVVAKVGEISKADILHAKSIGAIAIGFNIKLRPDIIKLAMDEKVLVKNYLIIYELLDEIADVLEGKQLAMEEKILGEAKILASFPYEKQKVLGIKVLSGRIAKGDKIRLLRGEEVIGAARITSVRHGKDQVSKIEEGSEGGILLSSPLDFTIGDMLVSHN